jgi:hypothetical protein
MEVAAAAWAAMVVVAASAAVEVAVASAVNEAVASAANEAVVSAANEAAASAPLVVDLVEDSDSGVMAASEVVRMGDPPPGTVSNPA